MSISYLVKINTVNITPYLKAPDGFQVEPNKLYDDAGRNMNGDLRATFIGIFPKLYLTFRPTTEAEMTTLLALLNLSSFSVEYYNQATATYKTATYYAGDFKYSYMGKAISMYDSFNVNLIPFSKQS